MPFAFQPRFTFDNTSADIDAEMKVQNKRLADIGDVLITAIDPPSVGLDVSGNLEGTWRVAGGKKYFVVLNLSDKAVKGAKVGFSGVGRTGTVKVRGEARSLEMRGGQVEDDFGAYEAHVYEID